MERPELNTQIYEEACKWFIECRAGDLNDAARYEFDRWLRKSPEHFSAYLEIAAIWNEAPSLDPEQKYDRDTLISQAALDRDNVVSFSAAPSASPVNASPDVSTRPHRARSGFRGRPLRAIAGSVAALGIAIGGWMWLRSHQGLSYETAIGEQRSLELADGSTVSLNSRSKIVVRYSETQRDVQLVAGQALFAVAKDAARPFIVKIGATQVRAVGTQFDVYQRRDDTVVTVVEGRVAILTDHPDIAARSTEDADAAPASLPYPDVAGRTADILVNAGEQLTVTPTRLQKSDHANIAAATAWTQRQLVFESASLSDVADEFNRYNDRQLIITDPGLETFHISGLFSSTDPVPLIRFLRTRGGLHIVETASEIRVEKNNPPQR